MSKRKNDPEDEFSGIADRRERTVARIGKRLGLVVSFYGSVGDDRYWSVSKLDGEYIGLYRPADGSGSIGGVVFREPGAFRALRIFKGAADETA